MTQEQQQPADIHERRCPECIGRPVREHACIADHEIWCECPCNTGERVLGQGTSERS